MYVLRQNKSKNKIIKYSILDFQGSSKFDADPKSHAWMQTSICAKILQNK